MIESMMNSESETQNIERLAGRKSLIGVVKLMRLAHAGVDLKLLGERLIARAGTDKGASCANALMDLCHVFQFRGDHQLAMEVQNQALHIQQIYTPPAGAAVPAVRVLALMGKGDLMANTPVEFLVEDSDVALDLLYLAPDLPLPPLPEHDVLFVAIGYSDENIPLLAEIAPAIETWPRPVLNRPQHIANLSRDKAWDLLKSIPGIAMPQTVRVERPALMAVTQGAALGSVLPDGEFPLIIRPVDSHAGRDLDKLDALPDLIAYLQHSPHAEFFISRFIDYRNTDGQFRKYRIVLIEGLPFVCHMAISSHWMIHYLNAGMSESAEKRAEEALFMERFDEEFARRHSPAFQAIHERTGLDYVGIDCSEAPDGSLLIFEVDSNMVIHAIDPVDVYPYKQPQMKKVFSAFRAMLVSAKERAGKVGG
jgi:glutathione synthase/RimK-type ligase-like ATP-grasp enzyme